MVADYCYLYIGYLHSWVGLGNSHNLPTRLSVGFQEVHNTFSFGSGSSFGDSSWGGDWQAFFCTGELGLVSKWWTIRFQVKWSACCECLHCCVWMLNEFHHLKRLSSMSFVDNAWQCGDNIVEMGSYCKKNQNRSQPIGHYGFFRLVEHCSELSEMLQLLITSTAACCRQPATAEVPVEVSTAGWCFGHGWGSCVDIKHQKG